MATHPSKRARKRRRISPAERAILVGFDLKSHSHPSRLDDSVEELKELASSAGAEVVAFTVQSRHAADPATLLGKGKVEEIKALAASTSATVILIDFDLNPTQQRNLEKLLDLKVIDRTQLILDIFASRARTREGRLQVELAQLNYVLPRLTGHGAAMSRLGAGIGTRGPGETKLETDRRRIKVRIKKLKDELEKVRGVRSIHRRQRQAVPLPTVALVGYTNAGKSTLFNRLTHAGVLADQKMFATLDPTVRALQLPSRRRILLSDTVGFIRNLPTTLVHAFRATLEEVVDAALILHVVDAASDQAAPQTAQVFQVLAEIGANEAPQILVLNKADLLGEETDAELVRRRVLRESAGFENTSGVLASARTGSGMDDLLNRVDSTLPSEFGAVERFRIPAQNGAEISLLHEAGRVVSLQYHDGVCDVEAAVPAVLRERLGQYRVPLA